MSSSATVSLIAAARGGVGFLGLRRRSRIVGQQGARGGPLPRIQLYRQYLSGRCARGPGPGVHLVTGTSHYFELLFTFARARIIYTASGERLNNVVTDTAAFVTGATRLPSRAKWAGNGTRELLICDH
ncbi:hypothetical protein J6590_042091 [Homalodisca vitripennis]|nr:hypothetical protein J6590_088047 [Homalodisca vitripennis]KAG8336574.1 hypothetical protein J6590_042091 [Homalodisca vitripennis]